MHETTPDLFKHGENKSLKTFKQHADDSDLLKRLKLGLDENNRKLPNDGIVVFFVLFDNGFFGTMARRLESEDSLVFSEVQPPEGVLEPAEEGTHPSGLSLPASGWSLKNVSQFLRWLDLGQYVKAFSENEITGEELLNLEKDDFKELSMKALGHRNKLSRALASLQQSNA